jgi:hypothetical protein
MIGQIIDIGQNGSESADIYIKTPLGKARITVSNSLLVTIAVEYGEDNFGTLYEWVGTPAYLGPAIEDGFIKMGRTAK